MKLTKRQLKRIIREEYSRLKRQGLIIEHGPFHGGHEGRGVDMPDPRPQDPTIRHWQDFKDAVMAGDYDLASGFLSELGCVDRMDQEAFMGDATELTADELAKEWEYRLQSLQEGIYEKLNNDATETSSNLNQEVYFGLEKDVEALCKKYADNIRFAQYGVTAKDVFEELKHVVSQIDTSYWFSER